MDRYFVASIVVAVLLTSCGSDAATDDQRTGADDQSVDVAAVGASPLEIELGFASDPERRRYQLITRQREADQDMVACMARAGFFYAVRPAEEAFRSGAFVGDGTRAWTEVNGLGITSSFVDALAIDAAQSGASADDTNLGYVASLTAQQQLDYDRALVGDLLASADATAEPSESTPGCWEQSYTDIVDTVAFIDAFSPELASLNSRLDADPRVARFQQEWSACMNGAGYSYPNETALTNDVYAELLDIELVDTNGVTQVVSPDALDALRVFERDVALAGFDCELGFADELAQLRFDYEREFLDDNRFRIADFQAAS